MRLMLTQAVLLGFVTEKGKTMWEMNKPYYSEKAVLQMLKEAPMEKLVEFLLMPKRKEK